MSERAPAPRTVQDFAEERSHRDAVVSNETIRATAQATILINGGAATAILAYLSKSGLDPLVLRLMSWCLVGYGLGVVFGATMMFCAIRSLDFYNVRWRDIAFPGGFPDSPPDKQARTKASSWWKRCLWCFAIAMACFLLSSIFAAYTLSNSSPLQGTATQQIVHKS